MSDSAEIAVSMSHGGFLEGDRRALRDLDLDAGLAAIAAEPARTGRRASGVN